MKTSPTIILLLDIKIKLVLLSFIFLCVFFYRAVIKGLPPPPQPQEKKEIRTLAV